MLPPHNHTWHHTTTQRPQKSVHVDRCVRFFGLLAAKAPSAAHASEVVLAVLEELLRHLGGHLDAADKTARLRACQLLQQVLAGLPGGLLLDGGVLGELASGLAARLQDKQPAIRAEATRALCHLVTDDSVSAALWRCFLCGDGWGPRGQQQQQQPYESCAAAACVSITPLLCCCCCCWCVPTG